jgi:MFS family permease
VSSASASQQPFRLSSLTYSVYVPTIFFSIGQGAVIPIIPLFARDLGASVAVASLIVAMRGLGQLLLDMPAGLAVSKWGDKGAMVAGTAMIGAVAVGAAFSPTPLILGLLVMLMGGGWAFWQIARLAYVSELAPVEVRGRALSMVGGMNRIGNFVGPVIGGFLANQWGYEAAFIAQAVMGLAAAAVMFMVVDEGTTRESLGHGMIGSIGHTLSDHRGIYMRAGGPIIALSLLRQARQVFLPLWGDQIGLDVAQIGLLTSISFFIDASLFYPTGMMMDRLGRKWVMVPCLLVMALGLVILPLTGDFTSFLSVAVITGIGNGFGSGIVMTMGADFSPDQGRGEFLGVWRLISDSGQAGGPVVISFLTGIGSLALAALASAGIGFFGAALMLLLVPETLRRRALSPPLAEPSAILPAQARKRN